MYYGNDCYEDERPCAETSVHDVEGWSDEDIGDVLAGAPEACWNIG